MSYRYRFLICILVHRKVDYSITAFMHLHAALRTSENLRSQCKIVFAGKPDYLKQLSVLEQEFKNEYHIDLLESDGYIEKLQKVFTKYSADEYEFFIKHDEDVFISSQSWLNLLKESPKALQDEKNLLTTINLSTGIPSWFYFMETFFNKQEQAIILQKLALDKVPKRIWGNNYKTLNKHIKNHSTWLENMYWETMNQLDYDYKGLHPIRTNIDYTIIINSIIIERYNNFQDSSVGETFKKINDRYFCNTFFLMNYKKYQTIVNDKTLYIDPFDEVPINKYCKKNNLNFCFLEQSLGIHITYNTTYEQKALFLGKKYSGVKIEELLMNQYLSKIKQYLTSNG